MTNSTNNGKESILPIFLSRKATFGVKKYTSLNEFKVEICTTDKIRMHYKISEYKERTNSLIRKHITLLLLNKLGYFLHKLN